MTLQHTHHVQSKTRVEHGVCFGTVALVLVAAAVILQWAFNLAI